MSNHTRTAVPLALGMVVVGACPSTASGQRGLAQESPQPYIAVVTTDDVYLRSGAGQPYYPIAKVHTGDQVRVLDSKFDWAEVAATGFPQHDGFEGLFGYVKVQDDAQNRLRVSSDGTRAVTLGPTPILGPNLNGDDIEDSWKPLVRLAADTELRVLERQETQRAVYYTVQLPPDATAWISEAYLRRASDAEIAAARRPRPEAKPEPQNDPQPDDAAPADAAAAGDAGIDAAEAPPPTAETEAADRSPRPAEPARAAGDTPADGSTAAPPRPAQADPPTPESAPEADAPPAAQSPQPGTETPSSDAPADADNAPQVGAVLGRDPARLDPVQPADADAKDTPRTESPTTAEMDLTVPALEEALERLREVDEAEAEVLPLRELYRRLAQQTKDEAVRRFASARAEQLTLWHELQQRRSRLERLHERLEVSQEEAEVVRRALADAAEYVAVGRLVASTVYSGERLPRLLRVRDPGSGRTIAYVDAADRPELVDLIGQLVGVVGEKQYDGGLRLNLVQPERIDILAPR